MGLTEIIYNSKDPAQIGSIVLDASVTELHQASSKATQHPIETSTGMQSDVSDHIHVDPLMLRIDGVVSNTPAEIAYAITNKIAGGSKDPVQEAHQEFLNDLLMGNVITIKTSLMEYPDMVLQKLDVTRDAKKGNALHFSATAIMMTFVDLEETEIEQRPVTQATKAGGKTKPKEASDSDQETAGTFKPILKSFGFYQ